MPGKLRPYHFAIAFVVFGIANELRRAWDYRQSAGLLSSFLRQYGKYIEATRSNDSEEETKIHMKLCEDQIAVQRLLDNMGQGAVTVFPPPLIAGARPPVVFSVVLEMFNPELLQTVGEAGIIETILRVQGEYKKLARKTVRESLNPLNWLTHIVLDPLMGFPFAVLEKAGFARRKMERSLMGKLVKLIFGATGLLVTALALIRTLEELQIVREGVFAAWVRWFVLSTRQMF